MAAGPQIDLHAVDDTVAAARAALAQAPPAGDAQGAACAVLAWHLRERAPAEALELAARALALPVDAASRARALGAEACALTLLGEAASAQRSLAQAQLEAAALPSGALAGDIALAAVLLQWLDGDDDAVRASLAIARRMHTGAAGRAALADALEALADQQRDPAAAGARWAGRLPRADTLAAPNHASLVATFDAMRRFNAADFAGSARSYRVGAELALACGMEALHERCLGNVSSCLMLLGDRSGGIEMLEALIAHCRGAGLLLPGASAQALLAMAWLTVDQIGAARAAIAQCEPLLLRQPRGRRHVRFCLTRAELHKAAAEWPQAMAWAERAREAADAGAWNDQLVRALYVQAQAAAHLGRADVVLPTIDRALVAARAADDRVIEAWVQATLGRAHVLVDLPRPAGQSANQARIDALQRALATLDEAGVPHGVSRVCDDLALAWESEGDLARALAFQRRARDAERRDHDREAENRLQALELRDRLQRARSEAAQSADAAALLQALGDIGRDLTAEREPMRVVEILLTRAAELLGGEHVALYRADDTGSEFTIIAGPRYRADGPGGTTLSIADAPRGIAQTARECLPVHAEPEGAGWPMRSRLHAALVAGERLLGVLTVQSERPQAYGERAMLVMRALAAYGAVALANAENAAALKQASAAKSMFFASMSHELRTPLNGILGFTQLLALDPDTTPRQHGSLELIASSGEHLLALINDLLDLTRIEAGRFELNPRPSDLRRMLALVGEIARVRADEKHLLLCCQVARDLPARAVIDETRLRQVLINLLGNAVKFTDSGVVELTVSAQTRGELAMLRFEVSDTGIGIPDNKLVSIFDAFEQTGEAHRREAGSGLGLAISRQLVRMMGGEIHVQSTLGRGSRFWFELEVTAPAEAVADAVPIGYRGPRRRVLVADDTASARALFVGCLAALGFIVDEAADGAQALAQAKAVTPDLVLMDRTMPVMDGPLALRRMRSLESLARVPVISISAGAGDTGSEEPLEHADAFVRKPVSLPHLLEAIGRLLALQWVYAGGGGNGDLEARSGVEPL